MVSHRKTPFIPHSINFHFAPSQRFETTPPGALSAIILAATTYETRYPPPLQLLCNKPKQTKTFTPMQTFAYLPVDKGVTLQTATIYEAKNAYQQWKKIAILRMNSIMNTINICPGE